MKKSFYATFAFLLAVLVFVQIIGCSASFTDVNIKQNDNEYIQSEDYQNYLKPFSGFTKTDEGYYFLSNSYIYFYGSEKNQAYPICNKPNCDHDNLNCTALLFPMYFNQGFISLYNNNLYVMGWETENAFLKHNYIYKISLETFKREKAAYLYDSNTFDGLGYIIHRGYVYFLRGSDFSMDEKTVALYRTKIGNTSKNSAAEKVYELRGFGALIGGLKAYANSLFFWANTYEDAQGNGYKSSLISVDIHSLDSKTVIENDLYASFVENGSVYYEHDENTVNCIDLNSREEIEFCKINGPCYISADSNYFYFDNLQAMSLIDSISERKIYVYDKKGNYVTEIIPKNPYDECFFGGDDVMIFKEVTELGVAVEQNGVEGFYVLDKSTLPDSYEFTYMTSK